MRKVFVSLLFLIKFLFYLLNALNCWVEWAKKAKIAVAAHRPKQTNENEEKQNKCVTQSRRNVPPKQQQQNINKFCISQKYVHKINDHVKNLNEKYSFASRKRKFLIYLNLFSRNKRKTKMIIFLPLMCPKVLLWYNLIIKLCISNKKKAIRKKQWQLENHWNRKNPSNRRNIRKTSTKKRRKWNKIKNGNILICKECRFRAFFFLL